MGNGGDSAACNETPLSSFRARQLRAQLGMGWVKLVLGVGVAAYSYRSVTHVNSLVRQVTVPKYSLLAKHTQALVNGLTGVHVIYSKYLLLSTYNKILQEEEKMRDRGEFL